MAIGNYTTWIIIHKSHYATTSAVVMASDSRRSLQFISEEAAMLYYKKHAPDPDSWQIVKVPN